MISCPSYIRGIITSSPSNRGGSGEARARLKTCAGRPTIAISSGNSGVTCIKYSTARTRILHAALVSPNGTHDRAWHRSSCRASSPIPFLPCFIPNLVSWKTEPRLSLSPLLPLILKLQIERDIRVLFRRMSRWKRSRRDSRPQHPPPPRYYPRLSSDSTNPRQGLNPTQPRRFEEWRGSSQPGCLAHAAIPLPLHILFIRVSFIPINIPLAAFFPPLSAIISLSYVSPPASLLLLPYFALIRVSSILLSPLPPILPPFPLSL